MEIDFDNPVSAVIGIFILIILGIIFLQIFSSVTSLLTGQKCKPYIDKVTEKETEILGLKSQLNLTEKQLIQCKEDYNDLVNYSITKKDFEEIKGYYNLTQIQINNLYQRFEQISKDYGSLTSIAVKNFYFSFTINIILTVEIVSLLFMKNEFLIFIVKKIKRRKKNEGNQIQRN